MTVRLAAIVLAALSVPAACLAQSEAGAAGPTTRPAIVKPPKPIAVPLTWQLDIEYEPLRSILIKLPGMAKPKLFWYLRYTVTNNSDRDHFYVPEFVMYTNSGQLLRAGRKTPSAVFYAIKRLHNDPLLRTQTSVTRKILLGEDNAKTGVAIWPDFDAKAGTVDIFIGGLSGETTSIPLPRPVTVTETNWKGEKKSVTKTSILLAKTLHLRYEITGEASARPRTKPRLLKKGWVMR